MTTLQVLICLVAGQRLIEVALSWRNGARLKGRGGREVAAHHHRLFVLLHASWLMTLALAVSAQQPPFTSLLAVFAILQIARVWVILSLGQYWTTTLVFVDEPPVTRGPYRWLRHPNYLIVTAEIAVLPMAFATWGVALMFTVLNAALLTLRVREEERLLARRALLLAPRGGRVGATR